MRTHMREGCQSFLVLSDSNNFKVKNEDVAKGYCMGSSIGAKMLLKIVFKPYPVMKETVSNLDTKEFYKDPISLIRTFDSLLK